MIVRLYKRVAIGGAVALVASGAYIGGILLTGNFAELVPGQVYRSAQPSGQDIARYAERYGIKTIVNLRGSSRKPWYVDEAAAARAHGIKLIDFKMSASKQLTIDRAQQLIALLRDAPKPILIHCMSGADRTGLVSVIYLNRIAGFDEVAAERQLSIRYGHFSIPYLSSAYAMDMSWEDIERYFRAAELTPAQNKVLLSAGT